MIAEYSDNDLSAYSGKARPGYEAMLGEMEAGKIDAVIAWHTDRLHRRPVELERFISVCDEHRIDVRTVRGGDLDLSTASGRMVARMLGASARHEVEHAIERQKRAKKQAALDGRFRGGRRSFGYSRDGLTLDDFEADLVRRAYADVLAGKALNAITRDWNASGARTTHKGQKWDSTAVKRVLLRERNAGWTRVDGQLVDGGWTPIVDEDTFTAVKAALTDPARRTSFSYERKYMGTGLYVCGKCSATMRVSQQHKRPYYICSAGSHLGRIQDDVDALVSEVVIGRLSAPDARIVPASEEVDVAGLRARREAITVRLAEAAEMFAEGTIDADQLKTVSVKLRTDSESLDTELARAQESSVLANLVLDERGVREAWDALSVDMRGKVVRSLILVTILPTTRGRKPGGGYFDPESIRIDWLE